MPQATVYFFLNFIPSYVKPNPDVQNKIDIISAGDSVRNSLMTIIIMPRTIRPHCEKASLFTRTSF